MLIYDHTVPHAIATKDRPRYTDHTARTFRNVAWYIVIRLVQSEIEQVCSPDENYIKAFCCVCPAGKMDRRQYTRRVRPTLPFHKRQCKFRLCCTHSPRWKQRGAVNDQVVRLFYRRQLIVLGERRWKPRSQYSRSGTRVMHLRYTPTNGTVRWESCSRSLAIQG